MLPPQEIQQAIVQVVSTNLGGSQDEVIQAVARLLGYRVTSAQLREVVLSELGTLVSSGVLSAQGSYLVLDQSEDS
jgi:hypothetical protein